MKNLSFNFRWARCFSLGFLLVGPGLSVHYAEAQDFNAGAGSLSAVTVDALSRGAPIVEHNAQQLMVPASTLKAATTAMALELLGPEFRFTTDFFACGTVSAGVLHGHLLVRGGGDPSLGSSFFAETQPERVLDEVQEALKAEGIERVSGKILLDLSLYAGDAYPDGRLWEDMANYYGAAPSALSWRDNSFDLYLQSPPEVGGAVTLIDHSLGAEVPAFNTRVVAAANNKDSAYIYGHPDADRWTIRGSIPVGRSSFRIRGALPHPAFVFGRELQERLAAEGVDLWEEAEAGCGNRLRGVATYQSPPLLDILRVVNQRSHNLMADHLFLECARQSGKAYDWMEAREVFMAFWKARVAVDGLRIKDGSGLSPLNLVNARFLSEVLGYMYHSEHWPAFRSTLAVGGVSGTLSRMWTSDEFRGRVLAKSGTMQGTMAYCGYLQGPKGEWQSFVVMVDRFSEEAAAVRKSMELFVAERLGAMQK